MQRASVGSTTTKGRTPFSVVGKPLPAKNTYSTNTTSKNWDNEANMDSRYIKNLQHQIYLLELELKQGQYREYGEESSDHKARINDIVVNRITGISKKQEQTVYNKTAFDKEKLELEDKISLLQIQLQDAEEEISNKQKIINELKDNFQVERQTIIQENVALNSEVEKIKRILEANHLEVNKYEKRIEELINQLALARRQHEDLKCELKIITERSQKYSDAARESELLLHQSQTKLNEFKKCKCQDLEAKEKEVFVLQATVDQLEKVRAQDELLRSNMEKDMKDLLVSNRELAVKVTELKKHIKTQSEYESTVQSLEEKLEEKEFAIQELLNQKTEFQNQLSASDQKISELQLKSHHYEIQVEQLNDECRHLEQTKRDLNERSLRLADDYYSAQSENKTLIQDIARLRNECDQRQSKLQQTQQIIQQQHVQLKRLESYKQVSQQLLHTVEELQKQEKSQTLLVNNLRSTLESGFELHP